jgi:hypothetical protein
MEMIRQWAVSDYTDRPNLIFLSTLKNLKKYISNTEPSRSLGTRERTSCNKKAIFVALSPFNIEF